jgi:uncharacterized protein
VAFGVPALTANHTNTVAQSPSYVAIAAGYRRELLSQGPRVAHLLPAALVGAGAGLVALQVAPADAFKAIAPALVAFGALLLAVQPRITRKLSSEPSRTDRTTTRGRRSR